MGRLEFYGVIGAIALVALSWFGYQQYQKGRASRNGEVATANGTAQVATGQANLAGDAAAITLAGAARVEATLHIEQDNRDAILKAPGAGAGVDPGFTDTLSRGMCQYASYASDPGCAALRPAGSGDLPDAR